MKIAIVHYHMGPGGVGRIISLESKLLAQAGVPHVVLTGHCEGAAFHQDNDSPALPIHQVQGLEYMADTGGLTAGVLADRLRAAATEALGCPPDIWHFHNHSLGKNPVLAEVVHQFARDGERMLLQIHDLAENGRAENYRNIPDPSFLYPYNGRIRYAFLNTRDFRMFTGAGLPPKRACELPNPVPCSTLPASSPAENPLLFAPVRCIRRKNAGELVFWSSLLPRGARIAVSRAPLNPTALANHDRWESFSCEMGLPIHWNVSGRIPPASGVSPSFESWVSHATHILTTSVAEGFGLPFLEAASWGKPLLGRSIGHLEDDHLAHDVCAGDLYNSLRVPLEWIGANVLRSHVETATARHLRDYNLPQYPAFFHRTWQSLVRDDLVDFGNLPESLQQGVIELLDDPGRKREAAVECHGRSEPAADWLAKALQNRRPSISPDQLDPWSEKIYQENLLQLFHDLASSQVSTVTRLVPAEKILSACVTPESFHFLLTGSPAPADADSGCRAVIFDVYGTLLIAPAGGIQSDPRADPMLSAIIRDHGLEPPESPSKQLEAIIRRMHRESPHEFPEIDLREVWRELLDLPADADTGDLVRETESAWHPAKPMPGADRFIQRLARSGIVMGILSNAQCNTLDSLGDSAAFFDPELCLLSYEHGMAKPSPELFRRMVERLMNVGIQPHQVLYVGNDPLHDIIPAAECGFKTALFTGHPESLRPGNHNADIRFNEWHMLAEKLPAIFPK